MRQRVAFALSQIFVTSRRADELWDPAWANGAYWDILASNAFGNFRDLLLQVALQPSMGIYLSHLHNRCSDPSINRFPDENFAWNMTSRSCSQESRPSGSGSSSERDLRRQSQVTSVAAADAAPRRRT